MFQGTGWLCLSTSGSTSPVRRLEWLTRRRSVRLFVFKFFLVLFGISFCFVLFCLLSFWCRFGAVLVPFWFRFVFVLFRFDLIGFGLFLFRASSRCSSWCFVPHRSVRPPVQQCITMRAATKRIMTKHSHTSGLTFQVRHSYLIKCSNQRRARNIKSRFSDWTQMTAFERENNTREYDRKNTDSH